MNSRVESHFLSLLSRGKSHLTSKDKPLESRDLVVFKAEAASLHHDGPS